MKGVGRATLQIKYLITSALGCVRSGFREVQSIIETAFVTTDFKKGTGTTHGWVLSKQGTP